MFKIVQLLPKNHLLKQLEVNKYHNLRTFLSQAYYCEEVWNKRLNSPLLHKINLEELYYELEQRFNKSKQLNAIDVDIFANAIQKELFCDELLDIVHKLRLTADCGNILESTGHAVVRTLLEANQADELLTVLDDRLNYGLFLDYYTANLLMDHFWKSKQYVHGARVASLLMLQEEFEHPLSRDFSLLHCYNYLLNPVGWPEYVPPPEPEEEVKIRVKYLRNPFDDEHFDLKDPNKIVGKTLAMITKGKTDPLNQSFYILGLALFGKDDEVQKVCSKITTPLYKELLDLVPEDSKSKDIITQLKSESADVNDILVKNVEATARKTSESDITQQCQVFEKWEQERLRRMEEQKKRLTTAKRLENIEDIQKALKEKEERLWFFENEEQIDLEIDAKKKYYPKRWFGHRKQAKQVDVGYVPPEIQKKRTGNVK